MSDAVPFWKRKTLAQMSSAEWESLCDGCGLCCLHKLEDADSGRVWYTDIACRLLDPATIRCRNYAGRHRHVLDCIALTPATVADYGWLPATCAYRLLDRGEALPDWHPLVSGDPESVHAAGISVRGRIVSEETAGDPEDHLLYAADAPAN